MLGRMDLRTGCWVREVCALRELDEVVRPTLRTKFRLGLFDHATPDKMIWEKLPEYDTTESRALARKVEVEGAVLLRNDGHILPLNKDLKTIAVIGPNADLGQTGDYSPKPSPNQLVTVLQAIGSHIGSTTQVLYAPGLTSPVDRHLKISRGCRSRKEGRCCRGCSGR
jgi:beta-glucosidase